jgi:hypothetical protein
VAFIGMSANLPMVHVQENDHEVESCHAQTDPSKEEEEDCCSKLAHKKQEEKGCNSDEENKKGCCNENNCPRTCCHIQVAFSNEADLSSHHTGLNNPAHSIHPSPNLPSPYLENSYPPPNSLPICFS